MPLSNWQLLDALGRLSFIDAGEFALILGEPLAAAHEAADVLDYDASSDFLRAYPVSRQWLTLLIRRMDAVASVYRLAATLSPGVDGLGTRVEFSAGAGSTR